MLKKFLRITLILSLILSIACAPVSAAYLTFYDVPYSSWYEGELDYAITHGIIQGTSTHSFSPNNTLTRGEFVTMLGRSFNASAVAGDKFTDVKNDAYYAPYVYWAVENGIVKGTSTSTFSPDNKITRQDMATMIGRAVDTFDLELPFYGFLIEDYRDANLIADYAKEYVYKLTTAEIILGDTNHNVNPRNNTTRAEGMAVIVRTLWRADIEPATITSLPTGQAYMGRFSIPDVGIDVALYNVDYSSKSSQTLTDESDSAIYMEYGAEAIIGDHNYQGFSAIVNCVPNKTKCYITDGNDVLTYICTEVGRGSRTTYTLYDKNYSDLSERNSGGLCTYTCTWDNSGIYYALWQPLF